MYNTHSGLSLSQTPSTPNFSTVRDKESSLERRIQNPVKYLRWSVLQKL